MHFPYGKYDVYKKKCWRTSLGRTRRLRLLRGRGNKRKGWEEEQCDALEKHASLRLAQEGLSGDAIK